MVAQLLGCRTRARVLDLTTASTSHCGPVVRRSRKAFGPEVRWYRGLYCPNLPSLNQDWLFLFILKPTNRLLLVQDLHTVLRKLILNIQIHPYFLVKYKQPLQYSKTAGGSGKSGITHWILQPVFCVMNNNQVNFLFCTFYLFFHYLILLQYV